MEKILKSSSKEVAELEMTWLTTLSDGTEKELVEGGRERLVGQKDLEEFFLRTQQMHLGILERQLMMIREGFNDTVPEGYIHHMTAEELEKELCGSQYVTFA
jgi:hypothetical protein